VWTDNAFVFTMRLSAHPERKTAFQRRIIDLDLLHGTSQPGGPRQNAFIERSNRTDNEELFDLMRFEDSESRRYYPRLWEDDYNTRRPHQGRGMRTPLEAYLAEYRSYA
jgi:transposase InsO family protein